LPLDFSQAPVRQVQAPALSFEEVAAGLLARGPEAIRYILPGGRIEGGEYCVGSLNGERGKSLKVNTKTGRWSDFAGVDKGGDLVALWAAKRGIAQEEARDEAAAWLGLSAPAPTAWIAPAPPAPIQTVERTLGPSDIVYRYETADGAPYLDVVRTPEKRFHQWTPQPDGRFVKGAPPAPRLLYNLPALLKDTALPVIIVEGEKKVHALAEVGILATTCVGGSAGVKMADWSPLTGRRIVVWRDNDEPGAKHAQAVEAAITKPAWLVHVDIPRDKPPKWDAADATPDERRALVEAAVARAPKTFDPDEWDMTKFAGEPSPIRYLVADRFALGLAGTVAAMGDTGKSMMLLDLAITVATCGPRDAESVNPPMAFGGRVLEFGTAVILGAEDAQDTIKRRLKGLDPKGARRHGMDPKRLRIIPFPNAGGVLPLIRQQRDTLETTDRFTVIRKWLKTLPDLKLIVIDPLASFVQAALDNDNAAGSFTMGVFSAVAAETGACLVCAHHVRKAEGEIRNVVEARAQVRGASAIVDNGRFTYVLWPAPELQAEQVCKRLELKHDPNTVVRGAVVKSNDPADRSISLFVRDPESGLLVDKTETERARRRTQEDELAAALVQFIAKGGAGTGRKPYTLTGKTGLFHRHDELPDGLNRLSKHKIEQIAQLAIDEGALERTEDGYLRARA
jgi:hypothetical protein